MTPQTYLFFGPSGSGKGTQAKLLKEFLEKTDLGNKVLYLETGERHREFAKTDSLTAHRTKEIIEDGGLMPEFIPVWLWTQFFVDNIKTGEEHIILDGISRRPHESLIIDSALQFYGRKDPTILSILVSPEWATERLSERGRVDDKEAEIKRRMEWYEKNVVPALDHFRQNPYYKFVEINGEQTIEEVHREILEKCELKSS
jgi:adenylate kinase